MNLNLQTIKTDEVSRIKEAIHNPIRYIETFLYIRDIFGKIIRFKLNPVQRWYLKEKAEAFERGFRKFLVLKSRKVGITTLEQALSFHLTGTNKGQEAVTLAQDAEDTEKIFRISTLYYDMLPDLVRPFRKHVNKRELDFPALRSLFYIGTAGSRSFGRGQTLQRLHGSEVASWDKNRNGIDDLIAGIGEACKYGEIVFESTPRGVGNFFHKTWREAKQGLNNYYPIFIAWYHDPNNAVNFLDPTDKIQFQESLSQDELEIQSRFNLSLEQLNFRREKKRDLKELFIQEYPEDDVSCFLTSGLHFFDISMLQNLARDCKKFLQSDNGTIIWEDPQEGKSYVAGGDVGEGLVGGDFSGIGILERESGKQVASLHGIWKPEIFAKKAVELCAKYNNALLAIEANNHGHSALNTVVNTLMYQNVYYHRDYDGKTMKLGWQTNAKTRPIMLDELNESLRDRLMQVNDEEFISECMTFADNGTGKYEAQPGFHDDRVIKWAIAWQARKVPKFEMVVI